MKQKQTYFPEFRAEAVKLALEQGLSLDTAASRLGIPKGTLGNWVAAAKNGEPTTPGGACCLGPGERNNPAPQRVG